MANIEDRQNKEEAGEIVVQNKFVKWLDNFWYHYKWTVIVVAFFVLVFVVCFAQCTQRVEIDIPVTFAGSYHSTDGKHYNWTDEQRKAVEDVLTDLYEKNGGVKDQHIGFLTYDIHTEEELRAMATEKPEKEGETGKFSDYIYNSAKQNNINELDRLENYMGTGECSIWLVSPYVYEQQGIGRLAMPLSEIFGETRPASAYNDCAIRLGDTQLYRYYSALHAIPEDTLLVLTRGWVMGASGDEATYQLYKDLFCAMVNFKAP